MPNSTQTSPKLSQIGQSMTHLSGVRAIMKDIQETLDAHPDKVFYNLSAGNPLLLPEVAAMWQKIASELLADEKDFAQVIGRYGNSKGYQPFINAICDDFNSRYDLNLSSKNIIVTGGSSPIYFIISNAFGGADSSGQTKKILLPLLPDYTGYGSVTIDKNALYGCSPKIEKDLQNHTFKYTPDFDQIQIDETIGAIILSRPNNPSGNLLDQADLQKIIDQAAKFDIPVFVDSAYAVPYPALNFKEMQPVFGPNVIHVVSLSKTGLPGERIGVAIGDEKWIEVLESFATNIAIHSARFGQALATKAIKSGELAQLSKEVVRPFYQNKLEEIKVACHKYLNPDLTWYLHDCQGGMFAWLWLENLPITDQELYTKLKEKGVIVVPGSGFFPGLQHDWQHSHECIRLSLTSTQESINEGVRILSEMLQELYKK
jgi:valine--pyruvate aminotransferase